MPKPTTPTIIVLIESVAKPGRFLRFLALAHEGDKRWGKYAERDRFIETDTNSGPHNVAKRRGLKPDEYKIVREDDVTPA